MQDTILEFQETEKRALELRAQEQLNSLQSEVRNFGGSVKKAGTTTLIVGGVFLVAFLIGRKIFKSKKPRPFNDPCMNQLVVKYPKKESLFVTKIKEHIALFLLTMLKEKLNTYFESEKTNEPVR
ncbi:MAG: hypothetical protein K2X86_06590 [Cytophagaceae bacterium]|nr:hypothetical protein [Cytophagaceae bacterium]